MKGRAEQEEKEMGECRWLSYRRITGKDRVEKVSSVLHWGKAGTEGFGILRRVRK